MLSRKAYGTQGYRFVDAPRPVSLLSQRQGLCTRSATSTQAGSLSGNAVEHLLLHVARLR